MSSMRYKKLLTNLPSMAAVVNSFQSAEVQLAVYQSLMEALNAQDGAPSESVILRRSSQAVAENGDVAHDLVEGSSIHSLGSDADDE